MHPRLEAEYSNDTIEASSVRPVYIPAQSSTRKSKVQIQGYGLTRMDKSEKRSDSDKTGASSLQVLPFSPFVEPPGVTIVTSNHGESSNAGQARISTLSEERILRCGG